MLHSEDYEAMDDDDEEDTYYQDERGDDELKFPVVVGQGGGGGRAGTGRAGGTGGAYAAPSTSSPLHVHSSPKPMPVTDIEQLPVSPGGAYVPSLSEDQIVLPGSAIQKAMALSLEGAEGLRKEGEDSECVICMEGFETSNPKMLTLCNCGMNKTLFHYSCLLEWTQKTDTCPSCRHELLWEEMTAPPRDEDGGEESGGEA